MEGNNNLEGFYHFFFFFFFHSPFPFHFFQAIQHPEKGGWDFFLFCIMCHPTVAKSHSCFSSLGFFTGGRGRHPTLPTLPPSIFNLQLKQRDSVSTRQPGLHIAEFFFVFFFVFFFFFCFFPLLFKGFILILFLREREGRSRGGGARGSENLFSFSFFFLFLVCRHIIIIPYIT